MSRQRHRITGNLAESAIAPGSTSIGVDLSSMTRATAYVKTTGGSADLRAEASPDDFTVPDASAKWFKYFASTDNAYNIANDSREAIPFPSGYDNETIGNVNAPCARRMRMSNESESTGSIDKLYIAASRQIA